MGPPSRDRALPSLEVFKTCPRAGRSGSKRGLMAVTKAAGPSPHPRASHLRAFSCAAMTQLSRRWCAPLQRPFQPPSARGFLLLPWNSHQRWFRCAPRPRDGRGSFVGRTTTTLLKSWPRNSTVACTLSAVWSIASVPTGRSSAL